MRPLAALLLILSGSALAQAPSFDGTWDITVACPDAGNARGYTLRFAAQVQGGRLLGDYIGGGTEGTLRLEGPIRADGSAVLQASGRVGNPANAGGGAGRDTPYRYTVQARFADGRGTGRRIETRPCDLTFSRR